MKSFIAKFIDIMLGVVLGFGFTLWPSIKEPWQYIAFFFIYLYIIDYWIDYGPALRKFPPKKEYDIIIDVAIVFSMFLCIYSAGKAITSFLIACTLFSFLDILWNIRAKRDFPEVEGNDKKFLQSWIVTDSIEIIFALILVLLSFLSFLTPLVAIVAFVLIKILLRIYDSAQYKKIYFA